MDAQRGLSVSGHRNTVLCLHLTSDTYHVTPSGRAPRARGKFWIRRVKLRIFRPDPKSHKSEGFPAAQIFKTHKSQNTYCRSAHFSKAVKFVGAQNPRGTPWCSPGWAVSRWLALRVTPNQLRCLATSSLTLRGGPHCPPRAAERCRCCGCVCFALSSVFCFCIIRLCDD